MNKTLVKEALRFAYKWALRPALKKVVDKTEWKVDNCILDLLDFYVYEEKKHLMLIHKTMALSDSIKGHHGI